VGIVDRYAISSIVTRSVRASTVVTSVM
jgi:hypothetical protein